MKKGVMIVNNNVEDVEALATRALLRRVGYDIVTATLEETLQLKTAYNLEFKADMKIDDVKEENFDFIILPGGKHVFEWIDKSEGLLNLVNQFNDKSKLIAAICAAPLFLDKSKLLSNKNYTAFPDVSSKIDGQYEKDAKVVKTANFITARSAGVVYDFVFEIINYFDGYELVLALKEKIVY